MNEENIKQSVFSSFLWKFGERIGAQLVSFVVSIVLARLLGPSEYGTIAMINVFITIANVFVANGLGTALVQKKDADNLDFSSVFYFNIILSLFLYLIIYLTSPIIADFYKMDALSLFLRVLALKLPLAAINSVQNAYVQKNMIFKNFFFSTIGATIFSAIIGIYMAYNGYGVWALVMQYLSNSVMSTIILWFTVKWRPILNFSGKKMKRLWDFGWKIMVWSLMSTIYDELRNLIIGKMYSKNDLAFYTRGKQWPNLIIININSSISSVLFPAMSNFQNDKVKMKSMTRKSIKISTYIIAPMMFILAAVAEPLVSLVLTDKWLPSVVYMRICCFYLALMPMQTANLEAIKSLGKSEVLLKIDIFKKIIQLLVLFISMKYGVLAIAVSAIFTTLIAGFINAWPNKKLLDYSYFEQLKDLIPNILLSGVMGILVYLLGEILIKINMSNLLILICQLFVGVFSYLSFSLISKNENFLYLKSLLYSKLNKNKKSGGL